MKKTITTILIGIISLTAFAQENDTAMLRKNHVASVKQYQFIHAFEGNKDTCLLKWQKYDSAMNVTYTLQDLRCSGFPQKNESKMRYKNGQMVEYNSFQNDEKTVAIHYSHQGDTANNVNAFYYQTGDSTLTKNKYYKNVQGRFDSSESWTYQNDSLVHYSKTVARYDEYGNMMQAYTIDQKGNPVSMLSYEYDAKGRLVTSGYTAYGEKPYFSQTYYQYNQFGQLADTYNTTNQKQEYFYNDNGLIKNVLAYNPKGVLEIEYLFEYTYQK